MHRTVTLALLLCASLPSQATLCVALATPLSFGLYDSLLAVGNETTALVTVTCTPGLFDPLATPYTLTIAGTGTGGDTVRSLGSGSNRLHYQVYKDAARSVVWGNGGTSGPGVTGSTVSSAPLVPSLQIQTAYARMPARQVVAPGIYLGSLLVTVDY